jgi:hypothetical protein
LENGDRQPRQQIKAINATPGVLVQGTLTLP